MATIYTTSAGDQWDTIAKKIYGDELHADYLMECNLIKVDIFQFDAGETLQAPDLPEGRDGTLPPWRTGSDDDEN